MHNLSIKNTDIGIDINLDEFCLENVKELKVKSSADGATELTVKIDVTTNDWSKILDITKGNSEIISDHLATNDTFQASQE